MTKDDLISRQALLDDIEELKKSPWFNDDNYFAIRKDALSCVVDLCIKKAPSAQPERYTKEELRVFQHGISLSLLSKRSAQHWQYDEDTATEIKFLERLYEKVGAYMRGENDG